MPAVPSSITEPIWDQFAALLPVHAAPHPLGCHRPRISDRVVFDKLVQVLVFGRAYHRIADDTVSATSPRCRQVGGSRPRSLSRHRHHHPEVRNALA
jgi:hypothetical protein